MNSDIWQIDDHLCRCCHAEGSFHNLAEPRPYCGDNEIYADMLRDYLNIEIRPIPGLLSELTYNICTTCISKLRESIQFKKQVQSCEKRFIDLYLKNKIRALRNNCNTHSVETNNITIVKEEPDYSTIELKEEYLNLDIDSNNEADNTEPDFDLDDDDFKSEDEELLSEMKKGKGKGKGKPEKMIKIVLKKERQRQKRESEKKKEIQLKKKNGKMPKFTLRPEDFKKIGETYRCSRCNKEYQKKTSLRFHVKSKHYKIPKYVCEICKKEFMTPAPYTRHKLEAHDVDERFKCNACKSMFNSKIQLKKHTNNYHMLGEKYKCDSCEYESYSFEGMYKHNYKHKTVKDYHCRFCKKAFLRKTTLDLHERIHTGDRRKVCKVCSAAFVQKSSLNYHMAKYHPGVNF